MHFISHASEGTDREEPFGKIIQIPVDFPHEMILFSS